MTRTWEDDYWEDRILNSEKMRDKYIAMESDAPEGDYEEAEA